MQPAIRDQTEPAEALTVVKEFNSYLRAGRPLWSWPTIAAALMTRHHWLVAACHQCGTIIDIDLRVKRRPPQSSIWAAAQELRCPQCRNDGGRIVKLARVFSA
jgi:hypothetical protein